jgi:hypothetical protein
MVASAFGAAFDKLDREVKQSIFKMLQHRRIRYLKAMHGQTVSAEVILLGDTPGPGRPANTGYHHTPFYSTKNSSLWLNKLLAEHSVPETSLLWYNTTLADGTSLSKEAVSKQLEAGGDVQVICLGANARKWADANIAEHQFISTVQHPQAWKRFHSKEPYPLMGLLQQALDL